MKSWTHKQHAYRGFTINEAICADTDEGAIVEIVGDDDRWESLADAQRYIDEQIDVEQPRKRRLSPFEFQFWI